MGRIVAIHSFRGGTGKSNSTANLAVLVAKQGRRVGIIDTDIQSPGIHVIFSFDESKVDHTLNDFLYGRCPIEECAYDVTESAIGNLQDRSTPPKLFLIPSSIKTGEIARVLREGYDVAMLNDGFQRLIRMLKLDYLFIDTHPGVNEETLLSIAISDMFIVILRPDQQDFQGTAVTVELARQLEVQKMAVVVNKIPPGIDRELLKAQIESGYGAPLIGMLPLNPEIAQLGSAGIFVHRYPTHQFTEELKRIAQRIMD